ncbi:MAG: CsbD family protein [Gammaproteobacteria bacterium]|nr:CsbD family protein [Gammaproteobacteria bacterium]
MKNITKILFLPIVAAFFITACDNNPERQKATGEKVKGTTQAALGNMTNDSELKADGKGNRIKGDLRSTKEDVKDIVTGN